MLTDNSLLVLLRAGYETSNADFVAHTVEHMSRTVYLMAAFLAEHQYRYVSSVDLQGRIDDKLKASGAMPAIRFNPVDWFSAEWTNVVNGQTSPQFDGAYFELFDREGEHPANYRIKPDQYTRVIQILSELHFGLTDPDLLEQAKQLDEDGAFELDGEVVEAVEVLVSRCIGGGLVDFGVELLGE